MTKRFEMRKAFLAVLLGLLAMVLVRCDREQPTNPKPKTGSILLDVGAPGTGTFASGTAKVVIASGQLRVTGPELDGEIFRNIPVQGGQLHTVVEDIPVGEVKVELDLRESNDAVVWEGETFVTVVANQETSASLVLQRVDDQPPEVNFTLNPQAGKVGEDFQFQAEVSDRHDDTEELEVRWDFDDDGIFETGWTTDKQASFSYAESGQFIANLEVRDKSGNVANFNRQLAIELQTGSVLIDMQAMTGGDQVEISRGRLRISEGQLEGEIIRDIPVQGGRLQTQVDGIPVGEVAVELLLLESNDAVVWQGNTFVTVVADAATPASIVFEPVDEQPPEVNFTVNPQTGKVGEDFQFEAEVRDRHDPTEQLEVRWDFDDDGIFETGWAADKQARFSYAESGQFTVNLEVRDKSGNVSNFNGQVLVDLETGSVVIDMSVGAGGDQVTVARGEVRIFGGPLENDIVRNIPVQGGRLQGRVDGVPVGEVEVELTLRESDDAEIWRGYTLITVNPDGETTAQVDLQPVDDQPPEVDITANPDFGTVSTQFIFVAEVRDRHDPTEQLEVRWDFDNDGSFETDWDTNKQTEYTFPESGNYRVALEVRDTGDKVNSITRIINVENTPPIARAGQNITRNVDEEVQLDGYSSSDPDGDELNFQWSQTSGPLSVALDRPNSPDPTFVPRAPGAYSFALIVTDGRLESTADEIVVTVVGEASTPDANSRPIAEAGPDKNGFVGDLIRLDGRGSTDPEGDELSYAWVQTGGPGVDLQKPGSSLPNFTPTEPGLYTFSLVVDDGKESSPVDEVQVDVTQAEEPVVNSPPVADAWAEEEVKVGEWVELDGSGSGDDDGDPLDFDWAQIDGPQVELVDSNKEYASFTPDVPGEYVFDLIVHDGQDESSPAEVRIRVVEPVNTPPVAEVYGPEEVQAGEEVYLVGNSSWDEDEDPLDFSWTQVGGPDVELMDADTDTPFFTPSVAGEYVFELVVSDGRDKTPAQVVVRVLDGGEEPPELLPRIVFASTRDGPPALFMVNVLGRNPRKLTNGDFDGDVEPEASPDGNSIAFASTRDGIVNSFSGELAAEIYVLSGAGADLRRLTDNTFPDHEPSWSPGGNRILFVSARDSEAYGYVKTDLYLMNADGSGEVRLSPDDGGLEAEPDWEPDGRKIVFTSYRDVDIYGNLQGEIYAINTDGSNWVNLTNDPANDGGADWSPNGRKIAFASNRPGVSDVFAMNPDGSGLVNLTRSPDTNDWNPAWSPDGLTIAFVSDRTGLQEIFLMNVNGSNQRLLAEGFGHAAWPTWLRVFEGLGKPVGW